MIVTIAFLACGSVLGQESDLNSTSNSAGPGTTKSASFKLKGLLISKSSQMALVDGRLLEVGDVVNGAEILAISEDGIQMLSGTRQFTVGLGGTVDGTIGKTPNQSRSANHVAAKPHVETDSQHVVKWGETLSGIALRYRTDGVTMYQMMSALYDTNVRAFNDDIDMLHEGAILQIPSGHELQQLIPGAFTAEVAQHAATGPPINQHHDKIIESALADSYGPVESGETLSEIAARVMRGGISLDRSMIALYHANRHAFDDNINVLFAGVVLRIPVADELEKLAPKMATAEVVRQTNAWRTRDEQHALLASGQPKFVASN